ncbi:MAG: hypothetical protein ACRDQC_13660, partial [Gaiellales bacterium]
MRNPTPHAIVQRLTLVLAIGLVAACGSSGAAPGATPAPTANATTIPGPSGGKTLGAGKLRLLVIERFGPLWYCDPDFYPIQRQDEAQSARERWAEVTADADAFRALADAAGLNPAGPFTDAQRLALYRT